MQAISLIVTHRNDDMSAASPSSFAVASKPAAALAAPARPKLRAIAEAQVHAPSCHAGHAVKLLK